MNSTDTGDATPETCFRNAVIALGASVSPIKKRNAIEAARTAAETTHGDLPEWFLTAATTGAEAQAALTKERRRGDALKAELRTSKQAIHEHEAAAAAAKTGPSAAATEKLLP